MRNSLSLVLVIASLLALALLGFFLKVIPGGYIVMFLLAFVGICFTVSLMAFLLFIFTVRPAETTSSDPL